MQSANHSRNMLLIEITLTDWFPRLVKSAQTVSVSPDVGRDLSAAVRLLGTRGRQGTWAAPGPGRTRQPGGRWARGRAVRGAAGRGSGQAPAGTLLWDKGFWGEAECEATTTPVRIGASPSRGEPVLGPRSSRRAHPATLTGNTASTTGARVPQDARARRASRAASGACQASLSVCALPAACVGSSSCSSGPRYTCACLERGREPLLQQPAWIFDFPLNY